MSRQGLLARSLAVKKEEEEKNGELSTSPMDGRNQ